MTANRTSEWEGDEPIDAGTLRGDEGISRSYTFKSRFADELGFNPDQLIAAAHAACFSGALKPAYPGRS